MIIDNVEVSTEQRGFALRAVKSTPEVLFEKLFESKTSRLPTTLYLYRTPSMPELIFYKPGGGKLPDFVCETFNLSLCYERVMPAKGKPRLSLILGDGHET